MRSVRFARRSAGLVIVAALAISIGISMADPPAEEYQLVWSDGFDTDGPLDPTKWTYEHGFVRNKEAQWYQPENAVCKDGLLIIEARREKTPNANYEAGSDNWKTNRQFIEYTSACVLTKGKASWKFGRFEVRAKVDISAGLWPAIWTVGANRNNGRKWPACGEIDIMEYYQGHILANAAWANKNRRPKWDTARIPLKKLTDKTPEQWAGEFHVWRMDWDEKQIRIYLDDQLLNTIDLTKTTNGTPDGQNPFHEPHYLLLNLAIGGTAGGDPSKTEFPRRYEIDYVRVYQKRPAAR